MFSNENFFDGLELIIKDSIKQVLGLDFTMVKEKQSDRIGGENVFSMFFSRKEEGYSRKTILKTLDIKLYFSKFRDAKQEFVIINDVTDAIMEQIDTMQSNLSIGSYRLIDVNSTDLSDGLSRVTINIDFETLKRKK